MKWTLTPFDKALTAALFTALSTLAMALAVPKADFKIALIGALGTLLNGLATYWKANAP